MGLFRVRFGYSIGHVLNDLCASMWFTYLIIYYQEVLQFEGSKAGYLILIGQVVDGIATPLVGYESDLTKGFRNYGRRKTWHLFGSILVFLSFPFIFNDCFFAKDAESWAKMIYYSPLITIFQIGWAATQISHLALLPELSSDQHERVFLNSMRYFFTVFSNIFVFLLTYFFLTLSNSNEDVMKGSLPCDNSTSPEQTLGPQDAPTFTKLSFTVAAVGAVFTFFFHFLVKEINTIQQAITTIPRQTDITEGCTNTINNTSTAASSSQAVVIPCTRKARLLDATESRGYGSVSNITRNSHDSSDNVCVQRSISIGSHGSPMSFSDDDDNVAQEEICPLLRRERELQQQASSLLANDASLQTFGGHSLPSACYTNRMAWSDWLKEPQFYLINILYMCTRLIVNVTQVYVPFYLQKTLQMSKQYTAIMPLIIFVSGMASSLLQKQFQAIVGRKIGYLLGLIVISGYCAFTFFIPYPTENQYYYLVYLSSILLGIGNSCLLIGSLAMCADLINNNTESGAFVYGAMSFSDKLSNGIVIAVIQHIYSPVFPIILYRNILVFIPVICVCVSCVILAIITPMRLGQRWNDRHVVNNNASINNDS